MILTDLVRRSITTNAARAAISDDDRTLTYREVGERAFRLVNALRDRGIGHAGSVATLTPNDITSLEVILGLALGGYRRVALHGMNSGAMHREMLTACGAKALITTREYYDRFAAEFAAVPGLDLILIQGDGGERDYERVLASASPEDALVPVSGDDVIHLAYSSGTSGRPRASVHTHESWAEVTLDHALFLPRLTTQDKYLAVAPLSHAASTVLYAFVGRGASIRIMPKFDPEVALRVIERERCTVTFVVPTMLQALAERALAIEVDLSSLRAVVYASAPISVETATAAYRAFGDVLFQSYGQSECLPGTTLTPEDHARGVAGEEWILRSAGRACLTADVRIADDAANALPTGAVGEILLRTRGRMRGIDGDPEATAQRITPDGFVRTNDVGYLDEQGYLFVVDRKNDVIISGGFNIWPAEIEQALLAHPSVTEAIVVGVPHPKWGETPHAVVVHDGPVTADELLELCRERIGSMKKPTEIVFRTDPIPRNELGKLSRRAVRDLYWPIEGDRQVSGA